ncbi:MAG: hypothetical protein FWG90_01225 [Oscillospiraceae bacterium]|nr:hypothetical protein [Oscillospiraceae bacterium]
MYQTMEEIEKQYDGNFVCMINCQKGEFHNIIGGEVIAVSKDKSEIRKVWRENPSSYKQYMGEFPDMAGGFLL